MGTENISFLLQLGNISCHYCYKFYHGDWLGFWLEIKEKETYFVPKQCVEYISYPKQDAG